MRFFKNLFSRLRRHGPAPVCPLSPARWRSTGRALPCAAAAAAVSAAAAFAYLAKHNQNVRALQVINSSGASKCEFLPEFPRLPPEHPVAIRVRRIAAGVIAAAWDDEFFGQRRLSERTGRAPIEKYGDLKVNVNVIDSRNIRACCSISGDIFVFAGMLDYLREDENYIATVLAHEVAHVVAEHIMWDFYKGLGVSVLVNFLVDLLEVPPGDEITPEAWNTLFMRPALIRSEFEADRIGLLLQSAAGYNPRVAPAVYLKLGMLQGEGDSDQDNDIDATHPSSKRRAQALSQPEIMGEALELYNTVSGRVTLTSQLPPTLPPQAPLQGLLQWLQSWWAARVVRSDYPQPNKGTNVMRIYKG